MSKMIKSSYTMPHQVNLGKCDCGEEPAPAMATIHAMRPNDTVAMAKGSPIKFESLIAMDHRWKFIQ